MKRLLLLPASLTLSAALAAVGYGCADSTASSGTPAPVDGGRVVRESGTELELPEPAGPDEEDAGTDARAAADAGDAAPADGDAEAGALVRKRVFVTKTPYNGDLKTLGAGFDGLDGGDRLCASAALAANLGGTWKAWLSSATTDARTRILDVAPWYLVDRTTLVFETEAQLALKPAHAIDKNETGTVSLTGGAIQRVWTGTAVGGTKSTSHCSDWTVAAAGSGVVGDYKQSSNNWTRYVTDPTSPCIDENPIYCFEQ